MRGPWGIGSLKGGGKKPRGSKLKKKNFVLPLVGATTPIASSVGRSEAPKALSVSPIAACLKETLPPYLIDKNLDNTEKQVFFSGLTRISETAAARKKSMSIVASWLAKFLHYFLPV